MCAENLIKISVITSLYRCEEYLNAYFSSILKIINLYEVEFIFIHNDPTQTEKDLIEYFLNKNKQITYQYVSIPREGLYKSWNRGIQLSKGDYIAVWNVDDVRTPNSIRIQAEALDTHPGGGLVYGNKYILSSRDDTTPQLHIPKEIDNASWFKKFQDGSLIMWRKSVHNEIGYFDEQFICAGDMDFWYRVAKKYNIIKCDKILGSFLNEIGIGISKKIGISYIEQIIIGLRYGFFLPVNILSIRKVLRKYNVKKIYYNNIEKNAQILKYNHFIVYLYSIGTILLSLYKGVLYALRNINNLGKALKIHQDI